METGTVFLTGGTGFLGGEILRQLVAAGYRVRMLVRRPPLTEFPPGVETVSGDLSDTTRLAAQMGGCRAVFHCAALVSCWAPDAGEFYRTNVEGFLNILEAGKRSGIGTLLYTSSFFALGPAGLPGADEDSPFPTGGRHAYEHSKVIARRAARQARASGFPIVILYPGVIYGPGPRTQGNLVGRLLSDFAAGKMPGLLGDGSQVWSFSFVEDVARGHLQALERAPCGGEFVLGGDNVSLKEFLRVAATLSGKSVPKLKIPIWLGLVAGAFEFISARVRGRVPEMTPMAVRMMYESWACDSSRAGALLDYGFRPIEKGLPETMQALGIPLVRPV